MKTIFGSLRVRLLLGYAVPLILFLGAALVAYVTIQRLLVTLENEKQTEEVLAKAFQVKESIASMSAAECGHHLVGDMALRRRFEDEHREVRAILDQLHELVRHDPNRRAEIEEVQHLERKWSQFAQQDFALKALLPRWNLDDLLRKIHIRPAANLAAQIRDRMNHFVAEETEVLEQRRAMVNKATRESIWAIVAAASVSVILSVVIALLAAHGILEPVHRLRAAFGKLRQGKFEAVRPYGAAEIADLIRGYNLAGIALTERTSLLENSERRYRTIVGTTSSLLWTTDACGINTEMSSWRSYTGQTEAQSNGDGWLDAVHPDDREPFLCRWREALKHQLYTEDEIRIRGAGGDYRHFCCRSVPIFDTTGNVAEWVRICDDVTEQKREEGLRQEKEAAEVANRAKSEFLAKMSHELRTPLNAVIGMSKMLRTMRFGALNAKQLDYLSDITAAGEHLLALINDILDLSKVEAGRMDLAPEPMSIHHTIGVVFSTLKTMAEERKLRLELELAQPDRTMVTDLARFKQILFNLLSNAVKFTPAGGRVTLRGRWVTGVARDAPLAAPDAAHALRLDVEDTGVGIGPADQARIGNEFFQANRSPSQSREGTGLGLALTRRLVDLMGGNFWFTSEPGRGSCFSFALPLVQRQWESAIGNRQSWRGISTEAADSGHRATLDAPFPIRDSRHSVLIIDDHEPTNKLLGDWLREAGLEVFSACDGKDGLEKARQVQPQLILLDIRLPQLNGLQVLTCLKSHPTTTGIPVVVVSVMEDYEQSAQLEILDWVVKPLDKDNLLQRLRVSCPHLFHPKTMISVLVVDHNHELRHRFAEMLDNEMIRVLEAEDEEQTLRQLEQAHPDLVVVDLDPPQLTGIHIVEAIRGQPRWAPIPIILTLEQMAVEEVQPLGGAVQGIMSKKTLTKEKFLARLRKIGLKLSN
jgi:PAS domain S-box-containing protein